MKGRKTKKINKFLGMIFVFLIVLEGLIANALAKNKVSLFSPEVNTAALSVEDFGPIVKNNEISFIEPDVQFSMNKDYILGRYLIPGGIFLLIVFILLISIAWTQKKEKV